MEHTRKYFSHDELLNEVGVALKEGLQRYKISEVKNSEFSNLDCLKSGLALFTFKFASLLKFDTACIDCQTFIHNMKSLFRVNSVPCDTYLRERLDTISPVIVRKCYTYLFKRLQRNKILDHFRFLDRYLLISLDGTGVFSSNTVHCDQCCIKQHKEGSLTYYHQILAAALVHPDQRVVYPFCPEPIMKSDGDTKNDCERNAAKRWVSDFRREHPHLPTVILADGLSSNEPFIRILEKHHLSYILVCKESDHKYLTNWVNTADSVDKLGFTETIKGVKFVYEYMNDVPLNGTKESCRVTVVRFSETKNGKTTKWMWVTDLEVTLKNIREFVKGGRARWHIENETFNTLKNQGYEFEHNFGHGNQYLTTLFTHLMMIAFFIDQCLQHLNKRFQEAVRKWKSKGSVWELMRSMIFIYTLPNFETLYHCIVHPPPMVIESVKL
jgi:hypothetical protein